MDTKEMIKVMQAFADGKKVESRRREFKGNTWQETHSPRWNWQDWEYRIVPEPKKEGRWERVEIVKDDGQYCLANPFADVYVIDALTRVPGFGGIDYQSPFDKCHVVRSTVPLMFEEMGGWATNDFGKHYRPGIPVAAWFWREEE